MKKNKLPVRFTGQHFTIDQVLVDHAIKIAEIKESDTVLDIGAGKGFITSPLLHQCSCVIAIERDRFLQGILRKKFATKPNVKIVSDDFRNYLIPKRPFKVVSNIPYGITAHILKSLMFDYAEYFQGGALVMQLESAQKLFAKKIHNPYTVFYHTFFALKLIYEVKPESFMPPPKVNSALLALQRKESPIAAALKDKYLRFLFGMLQKPDMPARTVLKQVFRKKQIAKLVLKYDVQADYPIVHMSVVQWSACFLEMLDKVPKRFHP